MALCQFFEANIEESPEQTFQAKKKVNGLMTGVVHGLRVIPSVFVFESKRVYLEWL